MLTSVRSLMAATILAGSALVATPALAQDEESASPVTVSGNASIVSDYRFRGLSLSGGDPAIQGGIKVATDPGFYVGTWGSSIDGGPVYGEMEWDIYAGWSGTVTDGLSADVGVLYYAYPTNSVGPADYWEPYASVTTSVGPASFTLGVNYAPSQDSLANDDNLYVHLESGVGIPSTPLTVSGHVGYTSGVLSPGLLTGGTDDTGFDYSIGASATVFGSLSVGVSYIGVDGTSINGFSDDTVVGTLTASF